MPIWSAEIKELEGLGEAISDKLPDLGKELSQLIRSDDPNVIMLYSRRCLEVMIIDLCECELKRQRGTEPLKGIIDKLNKENKIPSHIIASMHGLNDLSTFGTHPKDFDPEQVRPALINLDIIIKWYLKYKGTGMNIEKTPDEDIKYGIKKSERSKKRVPDQKKKLVKIISALFLLTATVIAVLFLTRVIGGRNQIIKLDKSIAVLPFFNDSADTTNLYFCNGMMDDILTHLQKISNLKVKARTSVEKYRNPVKDIREIGKELGVSLIVEGSVRKVGDDIRITVQLINAKTGNQIWAGTYNGKYTTKVLEFQSNVAKEVAASLYAIITPEEKKLIEKTPTRNLTAYNLYLRANNYLKEYEKNRDPSYYQNTITFYKAALEIDNSFARAYTGLANAYYNRYQWETYFKENYLDSLRILADRALTFDDQLDEAYYLKGQYYQLNGHIDEALENYDKALKINPNYYAAYERKRWVLTSVKSDYVNGIDNYDKALNLIGGIGRSSLLRALGFAYKDVGFFEKARHYYDEAFMIDSNKAVYFTQLFILAAVQGKFDEALEVERKHQEMDSTYIPGNIIDFVGRDEAYAIAKRIINYYKISAEPDLQGSHRVGFALWRMGKYKEAREYLNQQIKYSEASIKLERDIAQWKAAYYDLAITYAFLGEKEKAYQYLDELNKGNTCQIRWVAYLKYDPPLESIRNEERFQKILHNYEAKYQAEHERVNKWLEEQGMLSMN